MITMLLMVVVQAIAAMCDLLTFLLIIRLICRWCSVGVLKEFDVAGAPLLDRLFRAIRRTWSRLFGPRNLGPYRELGVALAAVTLVRLMISVSIVVQ